LFEHDAFSSYPMYSLHFSPFHLQLDAPLACVQADDAAYGQAQERGPMTAGEPPVTHVVLWMSAEAWPLQSQIVAADAVRQEAGRLTLLRDGRVVFQARASDVALLETYTSLHSAKSAFDERRATRGRGGLRVEELAPASGAARPSDTRSRGGPAEGIGFRVSEDR
jgi:hypothetical protein